MPDGFPLTIGRQDNTGNANTHLDRSGNQINQAFTVENRNGTGISGTGRSPAGLDARGSSTGVHGYSPDGKGVHGVSNLGVGVVGELTRGDRERDDPRFDAALENTGVLGYNTGGAAVRGISTNGQGVLGLSTNDGGVWGESTNGTGVYASSTNASALDANSRDGAGVNASSYNREGVASYSTYGNGVSGYSEQRVGVIGRSNSPSQGAGVVGYCRNARSSGVVGLNREFGGSAGFFVGSVDVVGRPWKLGGGFRIDHPLDPENKYLNHSFVESPEMKNVYDGVIELGEDGSAWVELPEWFGQINEDYRYQLTAVGGPAPELHVAEEISENHFRISGGKEGTKVSWQVTGIRKDRWAQANPMEVEQEKPEEERGRYLDPGLYDQPEEIATRWPFLGQQQPPEAT